MNDKTLNLINSEDMDLIVTLAATGPCSLETSPGDKDNWVESAGSLPKYICEIARAVQRSGKSTSSAIAIAVARVKKWAAGADGVTAKTQAKAAKALLQWEALKARNAAKQVVKASREDGTEYLMLSAVSDFSLDQVRSAWTTQQKSLRDAIASMSGIYTAEKAVPYSYIQEVYLNHVIADVDYVDSEPTPGVGEAFRSRYVRIPYSVENDEIVFGDPSPVELLWVDEDNDWKVRARV